MSSSFSCPGRLPEAQQLREGTHHSHRVAAAGDLLVVGRPRQHPPGGEAGAGCLRGARFGGFTSAHQQKSGRERGEASLSGQYKQDDIGAK